MKTLARPRSRFTPPSITTRRVRELEARHHAHVSTMQPFADFGRIGAGLVHELANSLTGAKLCIEALAEAQPNDPLVRQTRRQIKQLESYVSAARKQIKRQSDLRLFSIGAELRQVLQLLRYRARQNSVRVLLNIETNYKLYGDAVKFNQLAANVIANAIDASAASDNPLRQVVVRVTANGDAMVLIVSDTGPGIDPAIINQLFEPFYSTKSDIRGGLGIGLALVKQYTEQDFGGSVAVQNNLDGGATFTVRLQNAQPDTDLKAP